MELLAFIVAAYFILYTLAASVPPQHYAAQAQKPLQLHADASEESLEAWLAREEKIALDNLLANIAPGGRNVPDAAPGTVIASPSREHPDYYFQWIRDAAITTSTLVTAFSHPDPLTTPHLDNITQILNHYATLSSRLQQTPNPSGTFDDALRGLGEPKFQADGSAFTGSWGRPQRDGPALRALTLMAWLRAYNQTHPALWTAAGEGGKNSWYDLLYSAELPARSVIKADLEYVSHYWRESGFDLWEEVEGLHFFTAMVQRRALREGAELAGRFGDEGASRWYERQAGEMDVWLRKFWEERRGYVVATLGMGEAGNSYGREGLDCGSLLGALHGYPSSLSSSSPHDETVEDAQTTHFTPHSDPVLLTLLHLTRDQRDRFPINTVPSSPSDYASLFRHGTGLGRYPTDAYNGYESTASTSGNPWFLCTASAAEVLYRSATHFRAVRELHVSEGAVDFWRAILGVVPSSSEHQHELRPDTTYNASSPVYHHLLSGLLEAGDGYLEVVREHASREGSMSEQFDRVTGFEQGARDLTWSYGAFLGAVRSRRVAVGASE